MKALYDYITESILNNPEEHIDGMETYYNVENWLTNTYNITKGYNSDGTYEIIVSKNDCIVNVNGDVRMRQTRGGYNSLTNGMFRFGTINGHFHANYQNLKNLEGSPRVVTIEFSIEHNNCEFTCEGGPDKVGGIRLGANCISLEGMPQDAGKYLYCKNSKLKNLKGCGKSKEYHFECSEQLETTEGILPGECIRACFNGCKKLKSLKDLENIITGELLLTSCKALKSLDGLPTKFMSKYNNSPALLDIRDLNIKTLKGVSSNSDWSNVCVDVSGCSALTTVDGLPHCKRLVADFLPKLTEECYDNLDSYADEVRYCPTFPMPRGRKSNIRGSLYIQG